MESIGYLLADNSRMARWAFDRHVRELGVTGPQARLLITLDRTPGQNQGFYAERLEVEPITLCRMVDRLEESGLIERRADPADRRARLLFTTARCRRFLQELQQALDGLLDAMLDGLSTAEREQFQCLLERVGNNLSAHRETLKASHG